MTHARKSLTVALLTIVGLLGTSVPLRADEAHERCERRIHQAEHNLHQAIRRHGENSPQAHKRREQLEEVRRECGYRDHDHDRDRDRDHDHGAN